MYQTEMINDHDELKFYYFLSVVYRYCRKSLAWSRFHHQLIHQVEMFMTVSALKCSNMLFKQNSFNVTTRDETKNNIDEQIV